MEVFKSLLSNKVLLSALYSWFIAQFLKIIIELIKEKKFKTRDFLLRAIFGTGGMPSSHSATICAVGISIGIAEGLDSSLFALAVVMIIIVIRDATGVRLSTGQQAVALNQLLDDAYKDTKMKYDKLKEIHGHTPLETFVGAIVGVLVSLGMYFID